MMDKQKLVHELLQAAKAAGITVRETSLEARETKVRSGWAVLKGRPVIFMDPELPPSEKLELFASALKNVDLNNIYLSPAARDIIEGELKDKS